MDEFKATYSFGVEEVGDFDIANPKTAAERYKGTFQLTLKQAKDLYASFPEENINRVAAKKLKYVIEKYEGLVSTSPTLDCRCLCSDLTWMLGIQTSYTAGSFYRPHHLPDLMISINNLNKTVLKAVTSFKNRSHATWFSSKDLW